MSAVAERVDRRWGHPFRRWILRVFVDDPEKCWKWDGRLNSWGYAPFCWNGKESVAHVYAYEHFHGAIPDGFEVDHKCRNRGCVNPDHLEAVPRRINILRGNNRAAQQARQTHCKRGHELAGDNLLPSYPSRPGRRDCRACHEAKTAARRKS